MSLPIDLDHLVFTCADLESGMTWVEQTLGVRPVRGGSHPQWGTHNALIALGRERYLEILAPDPNAPSAGRANVAGRALFGSFGSTPQLSTWMLHTRTIDSLLNAALRVGCDLGKVTRGSRTRADGTEVSWEIVVPTAPVLSGAVPWLIDWGLTEHPSGSLPKGARLDWMEITHPDPAAVARVLESINCRGLDIRSGPTAAMSVGIACPRGVVVV